MDREQQIAFMKNAEQRHRDSAERWRKSDAYQAAMSKFDNANQPERALKRA